MSEHEHQQGVGHQHHGHQDPDATASNVSESSPAQELPGKVDPYRVVYSGTGDDGQPKNFTAIVFRPPYEGTVYKQGQMFGFPGGFECPGNEDGDIPQIEDGEKGVSWSWQK